ncbi:MAG: prepilin-type N-terminal cleavage/methylation domain-containing protein [Planctomycetes bacterium]|nr:prepilin-type N-terminal cleavage/methylation domain-containing protein [Planctomycetota bacterium]
MFARRLRSKVGFTLVETLIALALLAMIMAAVGVAVQASAMNYKANENIFAAMSTARQAMTRITSDLRTAWPVEVSEPPNQCSMITADGRNITYRWNDTDETLYLDINPNVDSYVLCENVTDMRFDRTPVPGDPTNVKDVRILMKVTVGGQSQTVASAAVIRRNM